MSVEPEESQPRPAGHASGRLSRRLTGRLPRRPEPLPLELLEVLHDPQPEEELIMHLEPDQLAAETFRRVPPASLGPTARLGLWALRVFVVVVSVMVIYTFIAELH